MRRLILVLCLVLGLACAMNAQLPSMKVVGPTGPANIDYTQAYLEYLQGNYTGSLPVVSAPSVRPVMTKLYLPDSYDLRKWNYITPVRDQNPWGSCWAHGALASLESSYMRSLDGQVILSPKNMCLNNPYPDINLDTGGNYVTSGAYLFDITRGPVLEKDDPYQSPFEPISTQPKPAIFTQGVNIVYATGEPTGLEQWEINNIKEYIYNYGAAAISYYHIYSKLKNSAYYCDEEHNSNHTVTIAGWDDNYSKSNFKITPPGDGAFLIKNSWGTGEFDKGYMWISYYDKSIADVFGYTGKSFLNAGFENDNKLLTYTSGYGAIGYFKSYKYGRIEYNPTKGGVITGLRIFAYENDVSLGVKVYVNDSLKIDKDVYFAYTGFNTVKTDKITFKANDEIVVKIDYDLDNSLEEIRVPCDAPAYGLTPTVPDQKEFLSADDINYYYLSQNNLGFALIYSDNVPVPVTGVKLDCTSKVLEVGEKFKLTANVLPADAGDKTVTWTSSNKAVATVDSKGNVTGLKEGGTYIKVKTKDGGFGASCHVFVGKHVTELKLSKRNLELYKGGTYTLVATVLPADAADPSVTWKSSNKAIATVDANGVINAIKPGTTYIKATTKDSAITISCKLTVVDGAPVTGVKLDIRNKNIAPNETFKLTATVLPDNASNKNVTWSSSNKAVATVDSTGLVKGIKAGTTYVKVKTADGGFTLSCKVVVGPHPSSITLSKRNLTLYKGEKYTLIAKVFPEDAVDKTVTWKSSNKAVATVDANGVISTLAAGTTYIKATTKDGGITVSCKLIVENPIIIN